MEARPVPHELENQHHSFPSSALCCVGTACKATPGHRTYPFGVTNNAINNNQTMKTTKLSVLLVALAAGFVTSVNAQWAYSATGQWASFNFGLWTVYQDEWGSSAPCTLYANNAGNFATLGKWSGGGVKTYCHTQANVNLPLGGGHSCTSDFNISPPPLGRGLVYDYIYDLWTMNYADEIMVYENWTTPTGGWGHQVAANVTIGGRLFSQVWQVNDGHNILMFFGSNQTDNGSEDLYAIMNWSYENSLLIDSTFYQLAFGVEVTSTSGKQQFTVNSFSANWQ